jgi:hypothetical protein
MSRISLPLVFRPNITLENDWTLSNGLFIPSLHV